MLKFEVGFEGEFIGVYYGSTADDAIAECKQDIADNHFKPDTHGKERLKGLIVKEVFY